MQQIGKRQMSILIIVFLIGSTPLFELGIKAKQDAWIAMTLAAAAGLLLTVMYLRIHKRAPEAGLSELYMMHFGKWLGGAVGLLHACWFAYESMRNVRDVGELTSMALLTLTPKWIVMLLILLASAYTVSKGLEVFVRVGQLLFPIAAVSYALVLLLLLITGLPDIHHLRPVLENGFAPVWRAAFPDLLSFPFGQIVIMLVFWKYVAEKKEIGRITYWSQTGVSIFLIMMNVVIMSVLGPELASVSSLPLLEVVQLIRLANFLERLDVIVTLLLFIGLYVKMTALYMASVFSVNAVTGIAYRYCVMPIGLLIYGSSFLEPNNTYHIWIGLDITLKVVPLFQVALPLLMLLVGVRKKYKAKTKTS
ncbi:GerAB/ArcD/ProY family transporter [Paenibacillus arenilitoris]|uniref:Endospore germination permease n=1 Tax=Paenibacillus arenilitoris TaxID=2772299 RepID=A0A927H7A9_9BACL|nr:endospore germination permease [Paenibacillus arenilitoris]MBD2871426.1 endospore germination permease [Paenibacillus arenilitoris]